MMCEECGIREAKFHLMKIVNDERTERNLCAVCMAKYQKQLPGIDLTNLAGILNNILERQEPPESAAEEEGEAELVCEQCGTTYAEFRKTGAAGCANCYKAFYAPIERIFKHVQSSTQHSGRIPEGVRCGASIRMNIDRLKQRMQKAIQDEEFEQAAKLRDAIRALNAQLAERERQTDNKVEPPKQIHAEGGEEHE